MEELLLRQERECRPALARKWVGMIVRRADDDDDMLYCDDDD
jgi:hypothetical protein